MRIGLFGGSFDPVHRAHIELLERLQDHCQFDQVEVIPCGRHALEKVFSVGDDERLGMLQLAIKAIPFLKLSHVELERDAPSYTIDTCKEARERFGPEASISLIVGSDILAQLHRWSRWQALLDSVNLLIVERPEAEYRYTVRGLGSSPIESADLAVCLKLLQPIPR